MEQDFQVWARYSWYAEDRYQKCCSSDRVRPAETPPLHHKALHTGANTRSQLASCGKKNTEKEVANFKWHAIRCSASC